LNHHELSKLITIALFLFLGFGPEEDEEEMHPDVDAVDEDDERHPFGRNEETSFAVRMNVHQVKKKKRKSSSLQPHQIKKKKRKASDMQPSNTRKRKRSKLQTMLDSDADTSDTDDDAGWGCLDIKE
jgi:hypothetical protein